MREKWDPKTNGNTKWRETTFLIHASEKERPHFRSFRRCLVTRRLLQILHYFCHFAQIATCESFPIRLLIIQCGKVVQFPMTGQECFKATTSDIADPSKKANRKGKNDGDKIIAASRQKFPPYFGRTACTQTSKARDSRSRRLRNGGNEKETRQEDDDQPSDSGSSFPASTTNESTRFRQAAGSVWNQQRCDIGCIKHKFKIENVQGRLMTNKQDIETSRPFEEKHSWNTSECSQDEYSSLSLKNSSKACSCERANEEMVNVQDVPDGGNPTFWPFLNGMGEHLVDDEASGQSNQADVETCGRGHPLPNLAERFDNVRGYNIPRKDEDSFSLGSLWTTVTEDLNEDLIGKIITIKCRPSQPAIQNTRLALANSRIDSRASIFKKCQAKLQAAAWYACKQLDPESADWSPIQCFGLFNYDVIEERSLQ